ncbi:hypothetical protein IQ31_03039 [Sphingobacterium siyangense]|uniref:Uncharacterized protein n=1 Tax=Sphingobacterium siyangense TaxID=459529 RepID=A0A562MH90_9SPHI|nr:hypothetical protein IQ31_03039 [Sphingobacterium siyangense]
MSFIQYNKNFLKFEFHIPLRGLIGLEREMKYVHGIRPEARHRIRLYYESVKDDIPNKIAFYNELLEIFGSVEKQFLLYSIYFEPDLEIINSKLEVSNLQYLELDNTSLYNYFQTNASSTVKGFLRQYFTEALDLSPNEWEEENGTRNPVTNKLIVWMKDKITQDSEASKLRNFVLNYTKLWNIYFCTPFDFTKALILLHKFQDMYGKLDPQYLKIDLKTLLIDLNKFIDGLLPDVYNSPLTDVSQPSEILKIISNDSHSHAQSYLKKMSEFQETLTTNSFFFQDLGSLYWSDLLFQASTTPPTVQKVYLNEIKRRHIINDLPNFNEIDAFMEKLSKIETPLNKEILDSIARSNYLFFL